MLRQVFRHRICGHSTFLISLAAFIIALLLYNSGSWTIGEDGDALHAKMRVRMARNTRLASAAEARVSKLKEHAETLERGVAEQRQKLSMLSKQHLTFTLTSQLNRAGQRRKGHVSDIAGRPLRRLDMSCSVFSPMGQQIPRAMYVIWKSERLIHEAALLDREWKMKEPCFTRRVITDAECAVLAAKFPRMRPLYDALPMNVMRADICRVLVVYYYGGIYMDLDVAWATPLRKWFNTSSSIVLGKEYDDGSFFCNWFFAATRLHPCIKRVLDLIVERIDRPFHKRDFGENPWLVHQVTGPKTFADAMKGCAEPQLTSAQVNNDYIRHLYGSQRWRNSKGYSSWNVERQKMGGWKSMLGLAMLPKDQLQFMQRNSTELVKATAHRLQSWLPTAPVTTADGERPPLLVVKVHQSTYPFPHLAAVIGNPAFAIDNNLESYSQTNREGENFWEVQLAPPFLRLPGVAQSGQDGSSGGSGASVLHCIRILNRRDGEFGHFYNIHVQLFSEGGRVVKSVLADRRGGISMVHVATAFTQEDLQALGSVAHVRLVRGGEVSMSEVQFFVDDPQCEVYRPLAFQPGDASHPVLLPPAEKLADELWANSTLRMFDLMMGRTYACADPRNMGEITDDDAQWVYCGLEVALPGAVAQQRERRTAVMLQKTVESVLEQDFAELGFEVHTFDGRFEAARENVTTRFGNFTQHKVDVMRPISSFLMDSATHEDSSDSAPSIWLRSILEKAGATEHVDVLKLNIEGNEWVLVDELVKMASRGALDTLFVEFHACNQNVFAWSPRAVPSMIAALQSLHRMFYLVGSRFNGRTQRSLGPFKFPCCVKATFIRKGLLDGADLL